jgi:alkanesulfonate monooxygenase SsuD/methylene tetrahydromethanopterin reductase-like flavin-dependent oxidoreductase (luciferase family)
MLCITGSWDEIVDRLEAFRAAGARSAVLRFAAPDQLTQLEACGEIFHRRGLLG